MWNGNVGNKKELNELTSLSLIKLTKHKRIKNTNYSTLTWVGITDLSLTQKPFFLISHFKMPFC